MIAMKFKTERIFFLGDVFASAVIQLLKHPFIQWMQYELHSRNSFRHHINSPLCKINRNVFISAKNKITRIMQTWLQIGHRRRTGWRAGRISLQRYKTSWKGVLRVLPPMFKTVLKHWNQVVVSCVGHHTLVLNLVLGARFLEETVAH